MISKQFKIPEGYIEKAKRYAVMPMDTYRPIEIGGEIMLNQVVREQMNINNIIFTSGLKDESCLIVVDYKHIEVLEMIRNAKKLLEGFIDLDLHN